MKNLLISAAFVAATFATATAQKIQFLTPEVAKCTFNERTGDEIEAKRTINNKFWQPCPVGNVIVNVESFTPLALIVEIESYTGAKEKFFYEAASQHKLDLLVIEGMSITVSPYTPTGVK